MPNTARYTTSRLKDTALPPPSQPSPHGILPFAALAHQARCDDLTDLPPVRSAAAPIEPRKPASGLVSGPQKNKSAHLAW
jgi:hypothetical protein